MLTAAAIVLAYFFLPSPWGWVVVGIAATIDSVELAIWLRLRKRRALTGAEAMVGVRGRTITVCRPEGRIKVQGQIWKAHCDAGADAGTDVIVTGLQDLVLEVVPAADRPFDSREPV